MKHSNDFSMGQAFSIYPWLRGVMRYGESSDRIENAISERRPLIPVLKKIYGLSQRSIINLSSNAIAISKIIKKHPLANRTRRGFCDKWEAFYHLITTLRFIAPDHQPKNAHQYLDLIKVMCFIYQYWTLANNETDTTAQQPVDESVYAWCSARAWTHIKRRPLNSTPIPTVNNFIIPHCRAWRDAVRQAYPGEQYTGKITWNKNNQIMLKMRASQWGLVFLFDRHPLDLLRLMENWTNEVRNSLADALKEYGHIKFAVEDQFSTTTTIIDKTIFFKKITDIKSVIEDALLANNCLADYTLFLLTNKNLDLWRIHLSRKESPIPKIVGHVMRCQQKGKLLTAANFLSNKPVPKEFLLPIKALQHANFDSTPRISSHLHQRIEIISHHARVKALLDNAKKCMENAAMKYSLEKVTDVDFSQIEEALDIGCIQNSLQISQQLKNTRSPFPRPLKSSEQEIKNSAWAISAAIIRDKDIPQEIISGIKPATQYRSNELIASVFSSVTITLHQKFRILNTKLTDQRVDLLIETLEDGNNKMMEACPEKHIGKFNSSTLIHLLILCYIFFVNLRKEDERMLIYAIASSIGQRCADHALKQRTPYLMEIDPAQNYIFSFFDHFDAQSKNT